MPPVIIPQNKKRGRIAKSDAYNLWERLKTYESAVLRFALDPQVPFTNNRGERDFRLAKVKQKYLVALEQNVMLKLIAVSPAIYRPWSEKAIVLESLFKWL